MRADGSFLKFWLKRQDMILGGEMDDGLLVAPPPVGPAAVRAAMYAQGKNRSDPFTYLRAILYLKRGLLRPDEIMKGTSI